MEFTLSDSADAANRVPAEHSKPNEAIILSREDLRQIEARGDSICIRIVVSTMLPRDDDWWLTVDHDATPNQSDPFRADLRS
jgi:hypothetical protein